MGSFMMVINVHHHDHHPHDHDHHHHDHHDGLNEQKFSRDEGW